MKSWKKRNRSYEVYNVGRYLRFPGFSGNENQILFHFDGNDNVCSD